MARTHEALDEQLSEWITAQPVFFVATAPSGDDGHVNLSPKGYDALRVLGPREVVYLDLTGSGAETIAHLRQNGRLTIMFCAFEGPPRILRLYGRARAVLPGDDEFAELSERFPDLPGARAVVHLAIERISSSCGYGVPRMELVEERPTLLEWSHRKGPDGLSRYRADQNATSIDGLPAIEAEPASEAEPA